jgi:hypothetical protein
MKISKLFTLVFVLAGVFIFSNSAEAQIRDSLPWFKSPLMILGEDGKAMDLLSSYYLPKSYASSFKPVKMNLKTGLESYGKEAVVLPNVKKIDGPIVLRRNGKCYKLGCPKKDCSKCALYWWDKNQDGKVQPKKELRCGCAESNQACKMKAKKIECRKKKGKNKGKQKN